MSGGYFDYRQYHINDIADSIEQKLNQQGKPKPIQDWYDEEYFKKYPEEKYYYTHPKEVQDKMREAVKILRMAAIYAQRVDYYLSGDDGEESFLRRLAEELKQLEENENTNN